jgi:hypothetical protein
MEKQGNIAVGGTLIPVIIRTDVTMLTTHQGNQKAWPAYVLILSLHSLICSKSSHHTWLLLALLPLPSFVEKSKLIKGLLGCRLYHRSMEKVLEGLQEPGLHSLLQPDLNSHIRNTFPLFAVHIADNPEQVLISCSLKKQSPITTAMYKDLDSRKQFPVWTRDMILCQIKRATSAGNEGESLATFSWHCTKMHLNSVTQPFWKKLPFADPSVFLVSDILHQLHKFFLDHPFKWFQTLVGRAELDKRISAVQHIVRLKHFHGGISHITQWTGTEHQQLQKIIIACCTGAQNVTPKAMQVLRSLVDTIYIAQYPDHTPETVQYLLDAISTFHMNKSEIVELHCRLIKASSRGVEKTKSGLPKHFLIPKIEMLHNLAPCILKFGALLQFTSDITEKLHGQTVKIPF